MVPINKRRGLVEETRGVEPASLTPADFPGVDLLGLAWKRVRFRRGCGRVVVCG
jgi:hypothetical protein